MPTFSVSLAIGARRIAERGAAVRRLEQRQPLRRLVDGADGPVDVTTMRARELGKHGVVVGDRVRIGVETLV